MNPRRLAIFGLVILLAVAIGVLARKEVMEREAKAPEPATEAPAQQAAAPEQSNQQAQDSGKAEPAKPAAQSEAKTAAQPEQAESPEPQKPAEQAKETPPPATRPSFDVVRVEPGGQAVVAGRAAPGSEVELISRGGVIDRTTANEAGEFVMMPPPLETGNHELTLRTRDTTSRQAVVVSVPESGKGDVLVVVGEPGKPSQVVQAGRLDEPETAALTSGQPGRVAEPAEEAENAPLRIGAVEAEGESLFVQGSGPAGANTVIYLNGAPLAQAKIGPQGRWSLTVSKGLKAGNYNIRIDQTGENGKVVARAEVPFTALGAPPAEAPVVAEAPTAAHAPAEDSRAAEASTTAEAPAVPEVAEAPKAAEISRAEPPLTAAAPAEAPAVAEAPVASSAAEPTPAAAPNQTSGAAVAESSANAARPPEPAETPRVAAAEPKTPKPSAPTAPSVAAAPEPSAPATPSVAATPEPAARAASSAATGQSPTIAAGEPESTAAANPVVPEISTIQVVRGDNLWQISRRIYGEGIRYSTIYEANADQIRDPDLIYPGQIFVTPQGG